MSSPTKGIWIVLLAVALLAPATAQAQGKRAFRASLMGGVGGSVDEDESGLGNGSFQAGFSIETSRQTLLRLRVGTISYDTTDRIGILTDPSVEYVTLGGEYQFQEEIYLSGLFAGLGAYRLEGTVNGLAEEETVLGVNAGATGDFAVTDSVSIVGELAIHVVNSDAANVFATGHLGVAVHF